MEFNQTRREGCAYVQVLTAIYKYDVGIVDCVARGKGGGGPRGKRQSDAYGMVPGIRQLVRR
ncbi:hypothetical protein J43TS9_41290 [Paenibacillus cineris]|nr:hypothetical protein J43TS9_41290 [Paenibacillus cineris]